MIENPQRRYKLLSTNSGIIRSQMKMHGESIVPIGCLYDPTERFNALTQRLKDSVFPALEKVEMALLQQFSISDIIYEVCISGSWTRNVSLKQVVDLADKYLRESDRTCFSVQLILNCKKSINENDVQIWGTVVDINYL